MGNAIRWHTYVVPQAQLQKNRKCMDKCMKHKYFLTLCAFFLVSESLENCPSFAHLVRRTASSRRDSGSDDHWIR